MKNESSKITEKDLTHLKHCLQLARTALEAGDKPFGSILVNTDGEVIAEARNRVNEINELAHPEIDLARWAVNNLTEEERKHTNMYTTGEHCPMCSAAHAWAGLGTVIYLSSAEQLNTWLKEMNMSASPVNLLPIQTVAPNIMVKGPAEQLSGEIKELHRQYYKK